MFHSSHPHFCPKSTKLSPHKALCLLKFSEWVGSKSLVCIYNFSCHCLHKQRCLFVLNDNQGPVEPVQGLGVVLSEVALLEATTFSTFLFATPQTTEGKHTRTPTHTLAVAVYTQQKESPALLFFYFYAAPRPRLELPQRTGTSAPGRRALRVCQSVF